MGQVLWAGGKLHEELGRREGWQSSAQAAAESSSGAGAGRDAQSPTEPCRKVGKIKV